MIVVLMFVTGRRNAQKRNAWQRFEPKSDDMKHRAGHENTFDWMQIWRILKIAHKFQWFAFRNFGVTNGVAKGAHPNFQKASQALGIHFCPSLSSSPKYRYINTGKALVYFLPFVLSRQKSYLVTWLGVCWYFDLVIQLASIILFIIMAHLAVLSHL